MGILGVCYILLNYDISMFTVQLKKDKFCWHVDVCETYPDAQMHACRHVYIQHTFMAGIKVV